MMARLAVVRDEKFQQHKTPEEHPESPMRLMAIDKAFNASALNESVKELVPRSASEDEIASVHSAAYIESLHKDSERAFNENKLVALDEDTFMSPETFVTAKLAAGAGLVAVEAVKEEGIDSSFVAVRPPGHHALYDKPMGFCLFNNIAIAARYAKTALKAERVLILDWDVHHGNGTQDLFYNDPSTFFISFHQYPFWPPDYGWYDQDGVGEGKGFNLNVPLPKGTGDRGYFEAFDRLVKPVCLEYNPDVILLSAGYDAHMGDPLAQQRVTTLGYAMLSQRLADLRDSTGAKTICFLEGGYNTETLAESAVATMEILNARGPAAAGEVQARYSMPGAMTGEPVVSRDESPNEVDERIQDVRKHFSQYWKSLR